jgi:excisionase family DNA binding protein
VERAQGNLNLDSLLDALVDRVAERLATRLPWNGNGGAIRPRLLTVEQAADYLGRSKAAVQHLVCSKRLPVVRDGHRVFLDVRALDRWIEGNTEPAENGS